MEVCALNSREILILNSFSRDVTANLFDAKTKAICSKQFSFDKTNDDKEVKLQYARNLQIGLIKKNTVILYNQNVDDIMLLQRLDQGKWPFKRF